MYSSLKAFNAATDWQWILLKRSPLYTEWMWGRDMWVYYTLCSVCECHCLFVCTYVCACVFVFVWVCMCVFTSVCVCVPLRRHWSRPKCFVVPSSTWQLIHCMQVKGSCLQLTIGIVGLIVVFLKILWKYFCFANILLRAEHFWHSAINSGNGANFGWTTRPRIPSTS